MSSSSINRRRSGLAAPCHNRNPDVIDDEGKDDSTGSGKEKDDQSPSLDKRVTQPGRHVGDRYVRIVRPTGSGLRGHGGRWVATEETMERTGGYGIRVLRVDRAADTLRVHAMFSSPAPNAFTIQVLTSPAHLVSIDRQSAVSGRDIVLVDQSGAERARSAMPQSQP